MTNEITIPDSDYEKIQKDLVSLVESSRLTASRQLNVLMSAT